MKGSDVTDETIEFDLTERDPKGDVEKNKVQALRRISIPKRFLKKLGIEVGDEIYVICDEKQVRITGSPEQAKSIKDDINGEQ